ncbi:MAG TPA: nuclear transport factor 2 family protein [Terriglobales bacterium]|nr:nuclear transport factor 2 family protein [Terriglobales bacterium]
MRSSRITSVILSALLAVGTICFPQTDPKNVPQPPTAELAKFDPFLGKYEASGDFVNLPWTGSLELRKVIKGWYIEQIILVETEGIDREFRILATWDKNVQKYRLWGFQTLPMMLEGEVRFEGDEMITEWVSVRPDGSQARSSNRYRCVSKDELEILSYRQVGNGPTEKIGFLKGKRVNHAEEAAERASDEASANSIVASAAESELRAVMADRRKAALEGDTEKVANSMAEEYVQTDINGYVQDKSAWLGEYFKPLAELIKAGKFRWEVYEQKNVQVHIHGDGAVVIGSLEAKGSGARADRERHTWVADPNASFSRTLRFTHLYARRNGRWLLVALHNSVPLPPADK